MSKENRQGATGSTIGAAASFGLWTLSLASVMAMFALASVLNGRLGDFLSFAAFLPVWAVLYLPIHIIECRTEDPDERQ